MPLPREPGGDAVATLIPYRNPRALAGYYCGVFSLIPVAGLILGPIAVLLGIMGICHVVAHPTAKGTGHAVVAVFLGIIGIFVTIGLSWYVWISGLGDLIS